MTTYNKEQVEELLVEYIQANISKLSLMSLEEHQKNIGQYIEKIYSRKRCKGITEKNKQCKNNSQPGRDYCKRHDQTLIIKELPKMSTNTCNHKFTRGKKKGHFCSKKTREGNDYCSAHLRYGEHNETEGSNSESVEMDSENTEVKKVRKSEKVKHSNPVDNSEESSESDSHTYRDASMNPEEYNKKDSDDELNI